MNSRFFLRALWAALGLPFVLSSIACNRSNGGGDLQNDRNDFLSSVARVPKEDFLNRVANENGLTGADKSGLKKLADEMNQDEYPFHLKLPARVRNTLGKFKDLLNRTSQGEDVSGQLAALSGELLRGCAEYVAKLGPEPLEYGIGYFKGDCAPTGLFGVRMNGVYRGEVAPGVTFGVLAINSDSRNGVNTGAVDLIFPPQEYYDGILRGQITGPDFPGPAWLRDGGPMSVDRPGLCHGESILKQASDLFPRWAEKQKAGLDLLAACFRIELVLSNPAIVKMLSERSFAFREALWSHLLGLSIGEGS